MADRLTARETIALVADHFSELPPPPGQYAPDGPLGWQGYDASRARAAERTGEQESVVCGTARIEGTGALLIAFEFGFLGGSLGERTGDRIEAAYAHARVHRLPVVPLVATGGSRMQEGMLALTQLQRVARQSALTREAGLPQIAVLRDPTTGGGWATLGAGADVVLALPGAQVGFAGSRVRPLDADPAAYTAEAQVAAGAADAIVRPEELRETLGLWLRLLTSPSAEEAPVPRALSMAAEVPAAGADTTTEPAVTGNASETGTGRPPAPPVHGTAAEPPQPRPTPRHSPPSQATPLTPDPAAPRHPPSTPAPRTSRQQAGKPSNAPARLNARVPRPTWMPTSATASPSAATVAVAATPGCSVGSASTAVVRSRTRRRPGRRRGPPVTVRPPG